jgi:anti-sigma regulatory factor (Ser/Thr protein kinase)
MWSTASAIDSGRMNTRLDTIYRFDIPTGGLADDICEIRARADLSEVRGLREALAAALARNGWSEDGVGRVVLAVTEALTNAVEHGSADAGHIELSFLVTGSYAVVRVADDGRPGVPVPVGDPVAPPLESTRGRGRLIMHALAQRVTTAPVGEGTEVILEFDRVPAA